jgi:hypothetical protein
MGHQETHCKACPTELETIPHIFETCNHAKKSWRAMYVLHASRGQLLTLPPQSSLIEAIDAGLQKNARATAQLHLVYSVLWDLWLSRNDHHFQGKTRFFSALLTSRQADDHLYVVCSTTTGTKLQRLRAARQFILARTNQAAQDDQAAGRP